MRSTDAEAKKLKKSYKEIKDKKAAKAKN